MRKRMGQVLVGNYFFYLLILSVLSLGKDLFAQNGEPAIGVKRNKTIAIDAFLIGRDFHHNKFIDRKKGLEGMAECNFTIADAADPQNMKLCKKLGLGVVVSEGPHLVGSEWSKMSDAQIDAYILNMVKKAGKSKAIIGYHICDEPSALDFPALGKAVAAVKKYAPGKLATINLYPNYATLWQMNQIKSQLGTKSYTEYLEKFVEIVKPQCLSYDNYMVQFSMDNQQSEKMDSYYSNLLEVSRVAKKYNLPFWNVVSSNQIRPFTTIPSPANLLFQAYTSLAAGASGIRWYTYHGQAYGYNPIDRNENKTLTWYYLQEVNRQLAVLGPIIKQLNSTGVYFTSPAPVDSLSVLPGNWVEKLETEAPMMVGEFVSKPGTKYLMVVNLSLEKSAKFKLTTRIQNEKIWIVEAGENGYLVEKDINEGYWLTAGAGVLIKCAGVVTDKDYSVKTKPRN